MQGDARGRNGMLWDAVIHAMTCSEMQLQWIGMERSAVELLSTFRRYPSLKQLHQLYACVSHETTVVFLPFVTLLYVSDAFGITPVHYMPKVGVGKDST